jgi:hypothetical protein
MIHFPGMKKKFFTASKLTELKLLYEGIVSKQ